MIPLLGSGLKSGLADPGQALNRLREYLQALVLRSLHEGEAFRSLAFVGGTALRFLHGLPRFSEDLRFSLVSAEGYAGRDWYDLMWHLSQRPPVAPNLPMLQNALDQTEGAGRHDARAWGALVRARLANLAMPAIRDDVGPFLERPQDAALLTLDNLVKLLPA